MDTRHLPVKRALDYPRQLISLDDIVINISLIRAMEARTGA